VARVVARESGHSERREHSGMRVLMPFTGLLNRIPKYVASRTLTGPLAWHGSELLAGDRSGVRLPKVAPKVAPSRKTSS
jgi:hypothetical protein